LKQPIGVTGLITPWNFPIAMATRKVGAALAAGNTCVLKPAPETPLSALALAQLSIEAGIPPGVFNVVPASKNNTPGVGAALTDSDIVRKISFTGSTQVGSLLMRNSAGNIKKLSLELGGNAPFVVFDDADIDVAVKGLIASKFRNAGQTCVCVNRIYVHSSVHDVFAEKLTEAVKNFK
jgi:succinate-semialdehyde dehydrogenase / glutarate-semialdehyde dehydrogenase